MLNKTFLPTIKSTLLCLLLFSLLLPQSANACTCSGIGNPSMSQIEILQATKEQSTVVFVGKVTEKQVDNPDAEFISSGDPVYVTFNVNSVYKGNDITVETIITTVRSEESCGYTFIIDRTYLVFTNATRTAGLCSNNVISPSSEILAALGDSYLPIPNDDASETLPSLITQPTSAAPIPTPPTSSSPPDSPTPSTPLVATGASIIGFALYGVFRYLRHKSQP